MRTIADEAGGIVTVKMIVLSLVLGVPTALAMWAVVRMRQSYIRFCVEHRDLAKGTASHEADGRRGNSVPVQPEAKIASDAADWECAGLSAPVGVSAVDREYYRSCWGHILGTFAHWPRVGLNLAETLTVNLMLNRGVVPLGCDRPSELPSHWRFPTAQGYREAQHITERAGAGELAGEELSKGLMLYRAMFEEILAAPTSANAMR